MADNDTCRVAVIDDNDDVRYLLKTRLDIDARFSWAGEAVDGAAGVDVVDRSQPDAVILDVDMPVLGGLATLRALRSRGYGGVIVLYSSDLDAAGRAIDLGADAGFTKIDSLDVILDVVAELWARGGRPGGP